MDAYLNLPYRNYSQGRLNAYKENEIKTAQWLKKKQDTIALNRTTTLPLAAYAGTYEHDVYGTMTIALENKKLVARFEHHKGRFATVRTIGWQ